MSIMVCDDCERQVDTDFDPMYEVNGKCLCELCDPGDEEIEERELHLERMRQLASLENEL